MLCCYALANSMKGTEMPKPLPATRKISRTRGQTFRWSDGTTRSVASQLPVSPNATEPALLVVYDEAKAEISNASMTEQRVTVTNTSTVPSEQVTLDESYGLAHSLVMQYVTAGGAKYVDEIPAPDQSLVVGGELDLSNSLLVAVRDAYIALFPANFLNFVGAYIATRKVTGRINGGTLPVMREPNAGENPPDAPGV